MSIYKNVEETIGGTPLIRLERVEEKYGFQCKLYAKAELFNPTGSAKDRAALEMINDAEQRGLLDKDTVIIEPTSGNTGIGLSAIGARRGYKVVIVMPDTMSIERIKLMKAYGAEVVLTDGKLGMAGSIAKAKELAANEKKAFIPDQFSNAANAMAHYKTTGPEIYKDLDGDVYAFVAGIGTGGTVTGTARYLKERDASVKIIGIEPQSSPFITKGMAGSHKIQGIGAGFIPSILDLKLCDEIVAVSDADALKTGAMLPKTEGILCGISSGAALYGAIEFARKAPKGANVVVLLPDTGERYLSSEMLAD